jgi:hypothetical protein
MGLVVLMELGETEMAEWREEDILLHFVPISLGNYTTLPRDQPNPIRAKTQNSTRKEQDCAFLKLIQIK